MKSLFQSKTFWLNAVVILATYLLNHRGVMAQLGLDADLQSILIAVANIVLRTRTVEPVSLSLRS